MDVLVATDTVWNFFSSVWWLSIVFHLLWYMPMWLTKAGHWSSLFFDVAGKD